MQIYCGYDRNKNKVSKRFRFMTIGEARNLKYGDTVSFIDKNGLYRNCKVNGKPRTWKREPERILVPVKYGLYEYAALEKSGPDSMNFEPLLVEIP